MASNSSVIILRTNPQLQSTRSYTRSTEINPGAYPLPCVDIFDCAANPVGGNITYTLVSYADYVGKQIDFNKSRNTGPDKIRITLPFGKTFSTNGSNTFEFDDTTQCVRFTFTNDPVVFTLEGLPSGGIPPLPGPAQPTVLGTVYGSQDTGSITNVYGFSNNSQSSRSNSIGCYLDANVNMDESNLISSYQNLSNGTNMQRSNVILAGNSSQLNNATNSQILASNMINAADHEQSVYIGDMSQVTPSSYSTCINNNTYGQAIQMAQESAYIGAGATNVTLSNNEFHVDGKWTRPYWHGLGESSIIPSRILNYDNSTSLVQHDLNRRLNNNTGSTVIQVLDAPGEYAEVISAGQVRLTSDTQEYYLWQPPVAQSQRILMHNPVSQLITSADATAVVGPQSWFNVTPITVSGAGLAGNNLQLIVIPANTLTGALGESIRIIGWGSFQNFNTASLSLIRVNGQVNGVNQSVDPISLTESDLFTVQGIYRTEVELICVQVVSATQSRYSLFSNCLAKWATAAIPVTRYTGSELRNNINVFIDTNVPNTVGLATFNNNLILNASNIKVWRNV